MPETFDPKRIHKKENPTPEGNGRRQLVYVEEFKKFIKENPGLIKIVLGLAQEIDLVHQKEKGSQKRFLPSDQDREMTLEKNGVTVTRLSITKPVYKIKVGNEVFAIKINPFKDGNFAEKSIASIRTGYSEFLAARVAIELFKDHPDVEVMEYQLGYKSKDNDIFVSKWIDGLQLIPKEHKHRAMQISSTLENRGFYGPEIWYNKKRNKFVIIDTGNYVEDVDNRHNKNKAVPESIETYAKEERLLRKLDAGEEKQQEN